MNKAITVSNITKSYPGVLANSNVSLEVSEGSIHAIVGENGAGKSTLMKILYGMVKPDDGLISIFEKITQLSSPKDATISEIPTFLFSGYSWLTPAYIACAVS